MGNISDAIAERLAARGVRRMFGVPGGDCNLDIIESADPYQLGWYGARASRLLRIPAVAFYHSHFCEAYIVPAAASHTRSDKRKSCCCHQIAVSCCLPDRPEGTGRDVVFYAVLRGR